MRGPVERQEPGLAGRQPVALKRRDRTPDDSANGSGASATAEADDLPAARAKRQDQAERQPSGRQPERGPRSFAELVTFTISSTIVLGLIGLTSYFYVTVPTTPTIVEVEPRPAETYEAGGRYYLPLTVRNSGGETGEEVRVRVTVQGATGQQETADLMIQFLAGGGSSRAVVSFKSDPRQGQIEAGVVSYLEP